MSFFTVLVTVVFLVLLALPGFIMAKIKILKVEAAKPFSSFLLFACQPMLVLMSFQKTEYSVSVAKNMLITAAFSVASYFIIIAVMLLIFRKKSSLRNPDGTKSYNKQTGIIKYASVFGNCGYMGIPFLQTLFGQENVDVLVYGAVVIMVFNLLCWTVGVYMITGDKKHVSFGGALLNPVTISLVIALLLFFICKKPVTALAEEGSNLDFILTKLSDSIYFLANMVTPLAMTVLGIRLSDIKLKEILYDKNVYISSAFKLFLSPVITMLIMLPFAQVLSENVTYTLFFLFAMPAATNTVLFSEYYGGDAKLGSAIMLFSTLVSALTIPLTFLLFQALF